MSRSERWHVGDRPFLDVRVPVGSIEIYAGDAGIVALTIDGGDADDFEITNVGDRVSIRHPSRWRLRGRSSRMVANVPVGTDVDIDSTSGGVRLIGRLGAVRIRTASGDVEVDSASRLDLTTASGDVTCGEVGGDVTVSSVSGDCTLKLVGGNLDATLTSGDLRVGECAGDLTAGSTSGDVRVDRCCGTVIAVRSIAGDVRVGLPSGIRVEADISTLSGRAVLPQPSTAAAGGEHGGERTSVRLQLKTVSGDIRVERSP